jgi:ABC-2 type transport system ATP-binding protein
VHSNAAISVRGVSRSFGAREVLRSVSLEIAEGDTFALVGKNGSGKTTLVEILATLLQPTSGTASVLGHDSVADGPAARRLIGYGPSSLQSFYLRLTGIQNLEFFGAIYGVDGARLRRRALFLMERLSIKAAAGERVEKYSDGMKARLSIARALLTDAPVLLLDEPTKSLDPAGREDARRLILREPRADGRPRTVFWVTHDEAEAREVAGRVGVLESGAIA